MSSVSSFFSILSSHISEKAKILTNPDNYEFKDLLLRWSDIDKKIPGGIFLVGTEDDVVIGVKLAVKMKIPFVPKSGGHSLWSTIGSEGFILDLSALKNIAVDNENNTITLQSGVLIKEANEEAWRHGLCLALGTANTAGVIPMALGGGLSIISGICGYTSDNIISARMVSAKGDLIYVSATSHPALLYALRGAGQYFGIIIEIALRAYPKMVLKTLEGAVWSGMMMFKATQADVLFKALLPLTHDTGAPATGNCLITAFPPTLNTVILILPVYFGPEKEAEAFFKPLLDLQPFSTCKSIPYVNVNDAGDAFGVKGGFKRFSGAGLQGFDPETWLKVLQRFESLKVKCPDAATSVYAIEWATFTSGNRPHEEDTAFSHRDIKFWAEIVSWYTDASSHEEVAQAEHDILDMVRRHQTPEQHASYGNWSRSDPIETRYRGSERLRKLQSLKREWDPQGVFTRELL